MFIEYFTNFPISITIVLLNLPLFIAGYRLISKRFVYLSMVGLFSMSFFLAVSKKWALAIESPMVAAIYGGLLLGLGSGIIIKTEDPLAVRIL